MWKLAALQFTYIIHVTVEGELVVESYAKAIHC